MMELRDDGVHHYHGYHFDTPAYRRKDDFDE
jgi:hypothetical protein